MTSLTGRSSSSFTLPCERWRQRVEGPERLDRGAEEVEAQRERGAAREDVEQAAADRVLAGLHDRAGAVVAVALEAGDELVAVDPAAGRAPAWWRGARSRRRDPLQDRVGGGEDEARLVAPAGRRAGRARPGARP